MNKEYLYLSDEELLVIDEKGHATKRNVDSDNMHEVLLLENDLEEINNKIVQLEGQIKNEIKFSKTEKIILIMFLPTIIMVSCGLATLIEPSAGAHIIEMMGSTVLVTGACYLGVSLMNKEQLKYQNGIKNELSKAYEIRENTEQRLSKVKEMYKDSIKTDLIETKKKNTKINDVVMLEPSFTPNHEENLRQLYEAHLLGYHQKVKKLKLKK